MMPLLLEPGAPQDQHVDESVVVVIGLDHVQPAPFAHQSGFFGPFSECAVAVVVKETQLITQTHRRDHQVEVSVIVKIVHDHAAGQVVEIEPNVARDVRKAFDVVF